MIHGASILLSYENLFILHYIISREAIYVYCKGLKMCIIYYLCDFLLFIVENCIRKYFIASNDSYRNNKSISNNSYCSHSTFVQLITPQYYVVIVVIGSLS